MIKFKALLFLSGFVFVSFIPFAEAQKIYELTGNVQKITDEELTVERNGETFEFKLAKGRPEMKTKPKVGEQVTVRYSLDLKSLVIQKNPKQLPGQVDPFKHILEDNRIFYEAQKSQESPTADAQEDLENSEKS